jgi:hypothetical protein
MWSLRTLEKLSYIVGIPTLLAFSGFTLYQRAALQDQERKDMLIQMETKYVVDNKDKVVKLENFRKKIFAVALIDQLTTTKDLSTE